MKLKEFKQYISGKVALYEKDGEDYRDLYVGQAWEIPREFFEREILVAGGTDMLGGRMDIQLK